MQTVITIADKCEYLLIKIKSALSLTAGVHSTAILKKHELFLSVYMKNLYKLNT